MTAYDLERILAAVDANTRVVYLANPNNPTGTLVTAAEIDRFLDRLPPHVITVLDEAYYDFANYFAAERGVDYSHSLDYVRAGRPVVVLRTFSKAQGLAGLRVGLRHGSGGIDLVLRAHAAGLHGFVAGRDRGPGQRWPTSLTCRRRSRTTPAAPRC